MKRDFLKDLNLSDDVIDKIMAEHGKDIESSKSKLTSAETERDQYKTQLDEASKQIESFKGMDIEGIKKAADDYKTQLEKSNADHQAQLAQLKFDHAFDGALANAKAKNVKAVKALFDMNTLKYDEATSSITGFEDQLTKIKTENDFLFESDGPQINISTESKSKTISGDAFTNALRRGANLKVE